MQARFWAAVLLAGICVSSGYAIPTFSQYTDTAPTSSTSQGDTAICFGAYHLVLGALIYYPTNARVRNSFGNSWLGYGVSVGTLSCFEPQEAVGFDVNLLSRSSGGNYVYLLPVGINYIYLLHDCCCSTVHPFVGASGDIVFSDVQSRTDGVPAALRTSAGLGLFAGIAFNQRWLLLARYNVFSPIAGLDFSGFSLSVSVAL